MWRAVARCRRGNSSVILSGGLHRNLGCNPALRRRLATEKAVRRNSRRREKFDSTKKRRTWGHDCAKTRTARTNAPNLNDIIYELKVLQ
jgi:hypothetical protein